MSRDEFDLGDFGDLEEPSSFLPSEEDAEFLPPDTGPSERPPRNTTFLIIAIILVLLFLGALGGIAFLVIKGGDDAAKTQQTAVAIYATNTQVQAWINGTATAKSYTATPTPTSTPTETPTFTPTNTPTNTPTDTPAPTIDVAGTQAAQTQQALIGGTPSDAELTATEAAQQTLNAANTLAAGGGPTFTPGTGGAIGSGTPTQEAPGSPQPPITATTGTQVAVAGSKTPPGGTKVSVQVLPATATALAHTGFFEDLAGGTASPSSLAVVGLAAFGLVGLIVAARRFRVR